jgi:hypothetical protein
MIELKDGEATQSYNNLLAVPEAQRPRVEALVNALNKRAQQSEKEE